MVATFSSLVFPSSRSMMSEGLKTAMCLCFQHNKFDKGELNMNKSIRYLSLAAVLLFLVGCASTPSNPAVGSWDVSINTPAGQQGGVWTLAADGTGVMGGDLGDQPVSGIVYDGDSVTFSVNIDAGGQALSLDFAGTVDGDSLVGELNSDFGAFDVSGSRQ